MIDQIILASNSKVRKEILDSNNINCEVVPSNVDEDPVKISLSKEEIIQIHSSKIYYIHMYGFLPGFMYLGGLDSKLQISRKTIPSRRVLKGSVAVGGSQTGIYPSNSPGGWYVIGNTPINLFDASNLNQPVAFPDSNYVKFSPVSIKEYELIKDEVEKSEYKFIIREFNG